jgi:hypothetical protein
MGKILTSSDTMMCPHGGQVTISALQNEASAGAAMVRPTDIFTVGGCPFILLGAPHPCVTVQWQSPSTKVKAGGKVKAGSYVLTTESIGMCQAADQAPQGTVLIQMTQTKASAQ